MSYCIDSKKISIDLLGLVFSASDNNNKRNTLINVALRCCSVSLARGENCFVIFYNSMSFLSDVTGFAILT